MARMADAFLRTKARRTIYEMAKQQRKYKREVRKKTLNNIIVALTIAAFIAALPVGAAAAPVYADDITENATENVPQSSFEYKNYPDPESYANALSQKMGDVYKTLTGKIDDTKTIPIPGLVETYVELDGADQTSDRYVPQGLCMAEDYMLITAYDSKKKLSTVIYVVDTKEQKLVSTLSLPNIYHAGGIAYDGENIWMTGDTSDKYDGKPFVQYMTYQTFLRLIVEPVSEVKESDISDKIYIKNKPSFLECDSGILWVGTYAGRKDTSEAYLNGYQITGEPGNRSLNTIMYTVIAGLDSSAQGADIEDGYLYVSSSYKGNTAEVKSSFITKYDLRRAIQSSGSYYVQGQELSRVEVPKMNEEIIVTGSTVHINFEAGASNWKNVLIDTDRILAVDKSLWGR